jgi:hypothetical protein
MKPAGGCVRLWATVKRTNFLAPAPTTFASYWWWYASLKKRGAER